MDAILRDPQTWLPILDAGLKSTMVLLAAAAVTLRLRRSSAAVRHLVWTSALGAALVLPAISLAFPRWQAPVLTLSQPSAPVSVIPSTPNDAASALVTPSSAAITPIEEAVQDEARVGARPAPTTDAAPSAAPFSWTTVAAMVWGAGAALILARLLLGVIAVQVMARRSSEASGAPWLPLAREIAGELGVSRVSFRRADRAAMPMTWGIIRPVVLMPADADSWPEPRLRIVLMHELAHVKRADCLTHLLAQAACAVYWMNPLAWLAAGRARAERERACDDLVLARGTRGSDYADQLLEIARTMRGRSAHVMAGASLAMAHHSQLEGRLMSILDPTVPRTGVSRVRAAGVTVLAFAAIVPLATMQTWAFEEERAMVPRVQAQPRPTPAPKPRPTPEAFKVESGAVNQSTVQTAVQGATQEATQQTTQGLLQGIVQGIAQGVTQGIGEGVAQGVAQGVGQGGGQGVGRGSGSGQSEDRKAANPKLVAALTEALKDSDKGVREAAMHALVQMRAPAIFEPLMQALQDPSADLREKAAFGLGQMGDKRAVAPLTAALKDESASVREQAAFALGQLDDPTAVSGLVVALKDESASVREQAAFALGQLDSAAAVDPLIAALKDTSASVKEQAAFALGQIGDSRATDPLIALLKDANAQVRQQAAFALSQLR